MLTVLIPSNQVAETTALWVASLDDPVDIHWNLAGVREFYMSNGVDIMNAWYSV